MPTLFLLSPARTGGPRAGQLARSPGELGAQLRDGRASIGDVFVWLSALYFRGKLAYAQVFADPSPGCDGVLVMAPGLGLIPPATHISVASLEAMAAVGVESEGFVTAVARDANTVDAAMQADTRIVLLGSIATGKYVDTLLDVFGGRLMFPSSFVGRGDMSRGGLMLRASRSGEPLDYAMVANTVRRGKRPPKLARLPAR